MIWVTWHQHRREAFGSAAVLAAAAVGLVVTAHLFGALLQGIGTCAVLSSCPDAARFDDQWHRTITGITILLTIVPALFGMFIAAPLLSGEFERGTHMLAWSQSITRLRWGTIKVAVLTAAVCLVLQRPLITR